MATNGLLIVISGPSGVGKGSVCKLLLAQNQDLTYSISATTRTPRMGEVDDVDYHFLSEDRFKFLVINNDFLEWAEVYGNYYGTLKSPVQELLSSGKDVILEIDTNGAMQIKSAWPEALFIFILPPSLEELRKRIAGRGTESEKSLVDRFSRAEAEMDLAEEYDYQIVNDDLAEAVRQVEAAIIDYKLKHNLQSTNNK
jgi:guanylate kinase